MPDSLANDLLVASGGDAFSQFLQLTDSYAGVAKYINAGEITNLFVNSSFQTSVVAVNHGLGVVPDIVILQSMWDSGDSGRWMPMLYRDGGLTTTQFVCFAVDMLGSSVHGPGNIGRVLWLAIGG
jgi:hypothetical protein